MKHRLTSKMIEDFQEYLQNEEKSTATIEKYIRDMRAFCAWTRGEEFGKTLVLGYKEHLKETYKTTSINSMLSSLNSFFDFLDWTDCKVKTIKVQKQIFYEENKELTKAEYERLLKTAQSRSNQRLYYIMQTICSTGIRISELKYITVEAVRAGRAEVHSKGKYRTIILPKALCSVLKRYIKNQYLKRGSIFVTKSGKTMNRTNIWAEMKRLCEEANVDEAKVFPHNLRHLFARTYYSLQKDIVRLADILGHSSVNTTRIYTIESGKVHRRQIQRLGLVYGAVKNMTS